MIQKTRAQLFSEEKNRQNLLLLPLLLLLIVSMSERLSRCRCPLTGLSLLIVFFQSYFSLVDIFSTLEDDVVVVVVVVFVVVVVVVVVFSPEIDSKRSHLRVLTADPMDQFSCHFSHAAE